MVTHNSCTAAQIHPHRNCIVDRVLISTFFSQLPVPLPDGGHNHHAAKLSNLEYYLKGVAWVVKCQAHEKYALCSNFEAEMMREKLSRSSGAPVPQAFFGDAGRSQLFAFCPITRRRQGEKFLRRSSLPNPPAAVQVFAGSIHADGDVLHKMLLYLALVTPRLLEERAEVGLGIRYHQGQDIKDRIPEALETLAVRGLIQRDGFVKPSDRPTVQGGLLGLVQELVLKAGAWEVSATPLLQQFFCSGRALGGDLKSSPMGEHMGCVGIGG